MIKPEMIKPLKQYRILEEELLETPKTASTARLLALGRGFTELNNLLKEMSWIDFYACSQEYEKILNEIEEQHMMDE